MIDTASSINNSMLVVVIVVTIEVARVALIGEIGHPHCHKVVGVTHKELVRVLLIFISITVYLI